MRLVIHVVTKLCGENFPSGKFREVRETSRRENFPPGVFPTFSGIFGKPLCKPLRKICVGRFPGKFLHNFPRNFRRKSGENFFRGSFLTKVSSEILVSYALQKCDLSAAINYTTINC